MNLKKRIITFFQIIRHPGDFLAGFIFSLYGGDKDKIPLPLLKFVIKHMGGWAGISIYFTMREYSEKVKRSERQKVFNYFILPVVICLVIFIGGIQKEDNFFFGFAQNLFSDIILILLVIYILPQFLNKPKNYKVSLEHKCSNSIKENSELILLIKNIGEEVFKRDELYWEIFIPSGDLLKRDIISVEGSVEADSNDIPLPTWKLSGVNEMPLFIGQELIVARLIFRGKVLSGTQSSPYKIYYRFRTIGGNFPTLEKVTTDFLGAGVPIEEYPNLGEYTFDDIYDLSRFTING